MATAKPGTSLLEMGGFCTPILPAGETQGLPSWWKSKKIEHESRGIRIVRGRTNA